MTHGSLFSGIGGFDLSFERAGMETAWQVEQDVKAQETLTAHFTVERYTDVRECKGLRPVDVISGGFPCQDLSVAGRRAGLNGERSGLWFEFHRILSELKPRWCVIENVPGLLSSDGGRDFAVLLRGLVELGYGVAWRILDAQYFGVAQRRRRVFIVGSLGDYSCLKVLFESTGLSGDSEKSRETGEEVAYTIRANPSHSGDKGVNTTLIPEQAVATPITADYAHTYVPNDTQTGRPSNLVVSCLDGASYADRAGEETKVVTDQVGVRRLTPTECERLQGFPDNWTSMHKDTVRYRQIGNAVAVPVAEWIGRRICDI